MEEWLLKMADKIFDLANKGGALSASAILFLGNVAQSVFIYRWKKGESQESLKRLEAWLEASKAEEHQTAAIEKVAEGLTMVANAQTTTAGQVAILVALIKDRRGEKE